MTESRVASPLKLLNPAPPAAPADCCHLVLSNYGGGFVQGDLPALEIRCGAGARLLLGSQANTRIYAAQEGGEGPATGLTIEGELESGALAVVLPDPVVPHAASRFRQRQHWRMTPTSRLILVEAFVAGRLGCGERFAFEAFDSEIRISIAGRLALVDRLALDPGRRDPTAPGAFGDFGASMTIYLAGPGMEPLARRLERAAAEPDSERNTIHGCSPFKDAGWVLRMAGGAREDLAGVWERLCAELGDVGLLGFDPSRRKW